jgi:hypothetical protein
MKMESGKKIMNNTLKHLRKIHNNHKHERKIIKFYNGKRKKISEKTSWEGKEKENRKVEKRVGK